MALHVTGDRCPSCKGKGLVLAGFNPLTEEQLVFRPKGWLIDRLECQRAACPHCGFVVVALHPVALKRLRAALREERRRETVTYHARSKKRK